jgi:hypothetical protein
LKPPSNKKSTKRGGLDDAAAIAVGAEPLDPDEETRLALEGYRDAMTHVLQRASEPDFATTPS